MANNVAVGIENESSPSYYFLNREKILAKAILKRRNLGIEGKNKFAFKGKDKNAFLQDFIILELGNRCNWCGSKKKLEIDHIQPLGKDRCHQAQLKELDSENIRVLCHSCHIIRHKPVLLNSIWQNSDLYYLE